MADLIDELVGIVPGSALDAIRARRPAARAEAERSYRVLFTPEEPGAVTPAERFALGQFVAGLHGADEIAAHYAKHVADPGAIEAAIAAAQATGPTGHYPTGPLTAENTPAPRWEADAALGPRLAAALAHTHMLVFHPRDASPAALQALLDAGWSTDGIVTLSQLVSFLTFQIRVVAGLRALTAA